jgi:flagellar biosynthesis chaperone FliJ
MADDLTQSNAKIRLERDLKNAQKKLKELQDARQGNIRSQTDLAQSIAGPNSRNRSQAIIDDLRTQTDKYNEEIRQQRQKVADTQKRLSEMQASSSAPENSASSGQAL